MVKPSPEAVLAVKLYKYHPHFRKTTFQDIPGNPEIQAATDAAKLMSLARSIHRLDDTYASGGCTVADIERGHRLYRAASAICNSYGLKCSHNKNPLGKAIYVYFPGGPEAGWGI